MTGYTEAEGIAPIYVSVKEAAKVLNLTPWSVYQLCDAGKIAARYHGRRRLVSVDSLRAFAESLPTERPSAEEPA